LSDDHPWLTIELPSPETLQRLSVDLDSPDPDVRLEAISELGDYSSPRVDGALIRTRRDSDRDVAGAALELLAKRGRAHARELILEQLREGDGARRVRALRSAGVVNIAPHLEEAWRALDGRQWVERMAGAGALAKAGAVPALPRIRALAERARERRQWAAEAHFLDSAALLGDAQSADLYLARLSSPARSSRLAAVAFLQWRGRLEALTPILGAARLRAALSAGRQIQERSARPGYVRAFGAALGHLAVAPADSTSSP
jgi:hypothetical protein